MMQLSIWQSSKQLMYNKQMMYFRNSYNPMLLSNFPVYFQNTYPQKPLPKIVYSIPLISILTVKYHRDDSIAKQLPNSKRQRNNFKNICQQDIFVLPQVRLAPQFCLYARKIKACEYVLIIEHSIISLSKTAFYYYELTICMIASEKHVISRNSTCILAIIKFQFDKVMNIKLHSLRDMVHMNFLSCHLD